MISPMESLEASEFRESRHRPRRPQPLIGGTPFIAGERSELWVVHEQVRDGKATLIRRQLQGAQLAREELSLHPLHALPVKMRQGKGDRCLLLGGIGTLADQAGDQRRQLRRWNFLRQGAGGEAMF
jgi:hypothetical protein